jgi:hypothetical protein
LNRTYLEFYEEFFATFLRKPTRLMETE